MKIEEIIMNMKKWSIPCNVFIKDNMIQYYYSDGSFYKEDDSLDEIELSEVQFKDELTNYMNVAESIFGNNNVYILTITK